MRTHFPRDEGTKLHPKQSFSILLRRMRKSHIERGSTDRPRSVVVSFIGSNMLSSCGLVPYKPFSKVTLKSARSLRLLEPPTHRQSSTLLTRLKTSTLVMQSRAYMCLFGGLTNLRVFTQAHARPHAAHGASCNKSGCCGGGGKAKDVMTAGAMICSSFEQPTPLSQVLPQVLPSLPVSFPLSPPFL